MLDIIKDLHLTVQNIVAGVAFISRDPAAVDAWTWEIKNGSNQPTVTISYKQTFDETSSLSDLSSYNEYKRYKMRITERNLNSVSEERNVPYLEQSQPCGDTSLIENGTDVPTKDCLNNFSRSHGVHQRTSKLSSKVFKLCANVQAEKDASHPLVELDVCDVIEDRNHVTKDIQHSVNVINDDDNEVFQSSNNNASFQNYITAVSSESNINSSNYIDSCGNITSACGNLLSDSPIKIKIEKDEDKFYCNETPGNKTTLQNTCCLYDKKQTCQEMPVVQSTQKHLEETTDTSDLRNKEVESQEITYKVKVEVENEQFLPDSDRHLPSNSSFDAFTKYSDVAVFTPEVILKTENTENGLNFSGEMREKSRNDSSVVQHNDYLEPNNPFSFCDTAEQTRFACDLCEKTYKLKNDLFRHMKIHTGERPFPCSYCGKCFRDLRDKKRHERTHTGEKPYACRHCNRRFARNHHKKRHERIHTGEKPYSCEYCEKRFTQVNSKKIHQENSCKRKKAILQEDFYSVDA